MAFFQLVLKGNKLRRMRRRYFDEKLKSIELSKGHKVHYTFTQKIRRKKIQCKYKVINFLKKIISFPENSWLYKKIVMLRTDGTFENYVLKSVLGFFSGILLTYMFFIFFVFQLNFSLSSATILCSVFGVILTIGLAFSNRVRCVVFLLLPQFFSKRGRHALMAYAFILTLTGPAKNTLHNVGVFSESLACGQDQLKEAVKTILDLIKQPFFALKDSVTKIIRTVKQVVNKIKQSLIAIKRLVLSILHVIKAAFEWLESIVNICNKTLGTPFDRCRRVFEGAITDCKVKLGPLFGGICNLTYIVHTMCYVVKPFDFICTLISYVTDNIIGVVRKKMKKFTTHLRAMFYVKVKFSHSFKFETNQSRTIEEISTGIVTEIKSRTERFLAVFDWMSFVTSFFIFFMLLRVIHYRYKWLTNDHFDNRYLTKDLREIDFKRAEQVKETILPLNPREKNKYASLNSIILIKAERIKLAKSLIFLCLTSFKLLFHIATDYSLYWILNMIRYHGRVQMKVQQPNSIGIYVSGEGFLAELYRSIVKAFFPMSEETHADTLPCLPDPIPPNLDVYIQIVSLIAFCWIMTFAEPYGLRLRHIVMNYYHPNRAKQRAVWLYNHIIRSRGTFLKFARRQLRRKFGISNREIIEKVTFKERLYAMVPLFNKLWPQDGKACLLCGSIERNLKTNLRHIKCSTPNCIGFYCAVCFSDLQNICTICRSPIEYGDLSDISEEIDSSDDQVALQKLTKLKDSDFFSEEQYEDETNNETYEYEDIKGMEQDDEDIEFAKRVRKGVKDDDNSSSSTSYSYSYQYEYPANTNFTEQQIPYKDIEIQKFRDDVTMQVFNSSSFSSSSDNPTTCFVIRARKKIKSTFKKVAIPCTRGDQLGSSTSIADTESFPTTYTDEKEVVLLTETDYDSESELLFEDIKKKKKKKNSNRLKDFMSSFINYFKPKTEMDKNMTKKPSLKSIKMNKTHHRRAALKLEEKLRLHSSSSSDYENEDTVRLLSPREYKHSTNKNMFKGNFFFKDESDNSDSFDENNINSDSYYSHRKSRQENKDYCVDKSCNLYEKHFALKTSPRFLKSLTDETKYFEIDEKNIEYLNALSGEKSSTINIQTNDIWSTINDEHEFQLKSTAENIFLLSTSTIDETRNKTLKSHRREPKFRDTNVYIDSDISSDTLERNSS